MELIEFDCIYVEWDEMNTVLYDVVLHCWSAQPAQWEFPAAFQD